MSQLNLAPNQAKKILWDRGVLKHKLHEIQKKMHETVNLKVDLKTKTLLSSNQDLYVMLCSRRIGKSHFLCALASEICMQIPGAIVKYACPKQKMVKTIIKPIMRKIFEDCPEKLKPEFKTNDNLYEFPNGSQIQIAGTDNGNAESLRGGYSHVWIVDEAGFCTDLAYVVNSILSPTTDTTDGIGILASTPSKHPQHEFITEFVNPWKEKNQLIKYTIYDNPMMTAEKIKKIEARYIGGAENPEFRREYLCEIAKDEKDSVIPEFDDIAEKELVIDLEKPPKFDWYVAMDIGGKDFTVALLAYYDFLNSRIVVVDEVVLKNKQNSRTIATQLRQKQAENFGETPPYLMFADNNNIILLNDLQREHNLNFIPTQKTDKESQINRVRLLIQNRKLFISPKCVTLITHLKNVRWARTKNMESYKKFAHSQVDGSHYDAVDALIYLVRNITPLMSKNPYPSGYGMPSVENAYIRPKAAEPKREFIKIVPLKSRRINK